MNAYSIPYFQMRGIAVNFLVHVSDVFFLSLETFYFFLKEKASSFKKKPWSC